MRLRPILIFMLLGAGAVSVAAEPPAPEQKPQERPPARNPPVPIFNPGQPVASLRTRNIKAVFRGQRVEISDRGGHEIRIAVTRIVNGQPQTERFEAADSETLHDARPDLASLYDRLAGTR